MTTSLDDLDWVPRTSLAAALVGGALLATGCDTPARMPEPVTLQIAEALPAPASASTADPAPPEARTQRESNQRLLGDWEEQFEGRPGCSDPVHIAQERGALVIRSQDCNSGQAYVVAPPAYDGSTLRVELHVPDSNRFVIRYRFHWLPDGNLSGEVAVSGPGSAKSYKVKWVKQR